jgi:hypothetical protein
MHECFTHLPLDLIKHILGYLDNIVIRHGKIIYIGKISTDDPRRQLLSRRPLIEMNRVTFPIRKGHRPGTITWFFLISTREINYNEETEEVEFGRHVFEWWKMEKVVGSYYNKVLSTVVTPIT